MLRTENQDKLNWQVFFATLLQQSGIPYEVSVRESYLNLWVDKDQADNAQNLLQEALGSPEAFHARLPFTRENVPASSSTSTAESVFMPEASVEAYMKIFKSFFNDEDLKNVRLLNWEELLKDAFVKDGVLYLTPLDANQFIIGMLQNALECLLQSFSSKNVTLDMIRKAVKIEEPLPASKPHMGIERVLAKDLIQDCFGVQLLKNEDPEKADQAVVYFDIKTLWHMLFPPAVQYVLPENELYKDKAIFSFNTHGVLLYVRQLLNNGVFLRVYQSHEGRLNAKPMFLSGSPGVEKPRFHVLVVDRSNSLKEYWEDLQKNITA